jgi:hypothetical protein
MSRVADKLIESTTKGSNGGDSYRKNNNANDIGKKKTSVSKASGIQCGAPFSPKQSNAAIGASSITSKILGLTAGQKNITTNLTNLP